GGEGAGSTFEVRIPIRVMDAAVAPSPPAPAPSLRGVTVLVVDSDPLQLAWLRETLERQGAVVVTTSSTQEVKARVKRDPPDVLVSALVLSGGDGLSLIRDIRQLKPE